MRRPGRHCKNIMAGLRLSLGGDGHHVLVGLAIDVVDRNFDVLPVGPLIDEPGAGPVGSGHPVIPKPIASLPAACADRTCGAVISARDDIAVAATNCVVKGASETWHSLPR